VATDCPDVYQTFEETGFPEALVLALRRSGFATPSPIQAVAWPLAMAGRDVIAVAKTGSGKTCGYLLPHLASLAARNGPAPKPSTELQPGGWWKSDAVAPTACVLAPTRELALQIADEASKFAPAVRASVVCMYGGVPKNAQLAACRDGCDLIVATPGRLCDFLEPPQGRTPPITVSAVRYLVLDEADRMLDMGFEPQIRKVVALCPQSAKRQTLLFTATWPTSVARTAAALTARGAAQVRIGDNGSKLVVNTAITQVAEVLAGESAKAPRLEAMLRDVAILPKGERAIVFVATKRKCDVIAMQLQRARFAVAGAIHGDKDQREREAALSAFRAGERNILVATDVAARGLDIPGVALVVVYDFPREVADYVHRVGRTGRAGLTGAAYTLLTPADAGIARSLVQLLDDSKAAVCPQLRAMAATKQKSAGGSGGGNNRWRGGGRGGGGRGGGGRGGGRGRGKW